MINDSSYRVFAAWFAGCFTFVIACYSQYSFHFTDEESDSGRLKVFPRVTQPEAKLKFKFRTA